MKRRIEPFGDGVVRLRLIEEADLETTLAWRNRDEARLWFKTSVKITKEQHNSWYHSYLEKDDDFVFIVEADGRPVGQASVYGIDWASWTGEVGRFLAAPDLVGRGYISRAAHELVRACTDVFGLSYLYLDVMENNHRAINVYVRAGFIEESRRSGFIRMAYTVTGTKNAES